MKHITHTYKTVGDCQIKADVYRPENDSSSCPLIVYIHGGCLMYNARYSINHDQCQLYLDAGYTVISIDYRLAPETKLPEIITDLKDFFIWLEASHSELGTDPQRIAVIGHSAGGYLAFMSGMCVSPLPKAIVSFYGYGDLIGDWYSKADPFYCQLGMVPDEEAGLGFEGPEVSEPYEGRGVDKLYLYYRQHGLWPLGVGGVDPAEDADFFTPYCPLQNVAADFPPTLLLHGENDTDVPYEQSVLMAAEFAKHGVEHAFVSIPDGAHGFDWAMDKPLVKDAFQDVLKFLNKHMGAS